MRDGIQKSAARNSEGEISPRQRRSEEECLNLPERVRNHVLDEPALNQLLFDERINGRPELSNVVVRHCALEKNFQESDDRNLVAEVSGGEENY
jgi:hypothetical protein